MRVFWFGLWLLLAFPAVSVERILSFHSDIELTTEGDVLVTETIKVVAEGVEIRRGIYRDFPTLYTTALWTKSSVDFEVFSVLRNGEFEPYHIKSLQNGVRVYIGNRNRQLSHGEHEYKIRYRTNRQVAFLDDFDRFSWNVTGNGWRFSIAEVSATVRLPDGVSIVLEDTGVWTGFAGEQGTNYIHEANGNILSIQSERALWAYQGLTFSIQIPKGFLQDNRNAFADFIDDNLMWLLMVLLLLMLLMFYVIAWHQVGRDPDSGVIMPLFYPPKNISPAAMRYVMTGKVDHKNLTVALISLAVKGVIRLKRSVSGYEITKLKDVIKGAGLCSGGELRVMMQLFKGKRKQTVIGDNYDSGIQNSIRKLGVFVKREYRERCFMNNSIFAIFGVGLSFLVLFFLMLHLNVFGSGVTIQLIIAVGMTSVALYLLLVKGGGGLVLYNGLLMLYVGWGMITDSIESGMPYQILVMCLFLVVLNIFFIYLLKAPTPFGRQLMDQIEGFKLYLSTAEQHRLDVLHPPEMSSELFEKYLPFAMALGVENEWSECLAKHMRNSVGGADGGSYQPDWYSGDSVSFSRGSFFNSLSSNMSSSIAAASVPPSSSGGGGGGGSSGGGGGGGGGGGW